MYDPSLSVLLQQIAWNGPALLVLVVGMFLALVTFSRHPLPSILTMIACGLMTLTRLSLVFINYSLMRGNAGRDFDGTRQFLAIGNTIFGAVGLALLVAAVFVSRKNPTNALGERNY
jgi:hypothetical protein